MSVWRQGGFDQPINPEHEQEARLVEQARAGSERAFAALLARYQQPAFRLIFYLVGDEDEARDLTRVALKHALLHMPRVPGGQSIRPWLLRVATLVALDAVRQRSETPQALLANLQLPPPAGAPRIVDADPLARSVPTLPGPDVRRLAANPDATIAHAWEQIPVDIERELIRRLLAGLPDGDAELLALGVVGQIPTPDLAALAGTSQRSIRRRIARALILFQTRYEVIWQNALPAAPAARELPSAEASPAAGSPAASRRVRPSMRGTPPAPPLSPQERLATLRGPAAPPEVASAAPRIDPNQTVVLPHEVADARPPAAPAWTVLPPDLAAIETIVTTPAGDDLRTATVPVRPADETYTPAAPVPMAAAPDVQPFDPAITIPPATPRRLPRFGPPPDEVLTAVPPIVSPAASLPHLGNAAPPIIFMPAASPAAPLLHAVSPVVFQAVSTPPVDAAPDADDAGGEPPDRAPAIDVAPIPPPAAEIASAAEAGPPPAAGIALAAASAPDANADQPPIAAAEFSPDAASAPAAEIQADADLAPQDLADVGAGPPEIRRIAVPPDKQTDDVPTVSTPADTPAAAIAVPAMFAGQASEPTPSSVRTADHDLPAEITALAPPADQTAEQAASAGMGVEREPPADQTVAQELPNEPAPSTTISVESEAPAGMGVEREPPALHQKTDGDTVIVTTGARDAYVARHRPAWLDVGDLAGISGITEATPLPPEETPPVWGAPPVVDVTLDVAAVNDVPPPEPDLADLSAIVAPVEPPPPPLSARPPSRPMPRLKRDLVEPPPTW